MKTKLTLTIDEKKILKARRYARSRKTSISNLVETYIDSLWENSKAQNWANKWAGVADINKALDLAKKDSRMQQIAKKHIK